MAHEDALLSIALILTLGMAAQWIAQRLRVPSILLLLTTGFLAGAVTGVLDPDELFGHLLFPLVSISVALILYEGGLSLKLNEIRGIGRAFMNIITLGALITWLLGSLGAHYILGLNWEISI
ncbi:MAG: cation:proton antiporter, partial [Chloroflexota bacterium]